MAENKEAHRLRKDIAYLSGLINSARNKPELYHSNQNPRLSSQPWAQSQEYKSGVPYQLKSSRSFHNQNHVPFPSSSKFVAAKFKSSTQSANLQASTLSSVRKTPYHKPPQNSTCLPVQMIKIDKGLLADVKQGNQKHPMDETSSESNYVISETMPNQAKKLTLHINPKFLQANSIPTINSTAGFVPNPVFKANESSMSTALSKSVKITNPGTLVQCVLKQASQANSVSYDISNESTDGRSELSVNPETSTQTKSISSNIHDVATRIKLVANVIPSVETLSNLQSSRVLQKKITITKSKITNLPKTLGYKVPSLPHSEITKKQILDLRKSLGYVIPNLSFSGDDNNQIPKRESPPIQQEDKLKAQIKQLRQSIGYDIQAFSCSSGQQFQRKKFKLDKTMSIASIGSPSKSDLNEVFTRSTSPYILKSTSPYKLDKRTTCYPSFNFSSNLHQNNSDRKIVQSKYTLNKKARISPKIVRSRFKFVGRANSMQTSQKLKGISKAQQAAQVIISKYRIRTVPEGKKQITTNSNWRNFGHTWKIQRSEKAYSYTSPKKNPWSFPSSCNNRLHSSQKWRSSSSLKTAFKTNAYSWRRSSNSRYIHPSTRHNRYEFEHLNQYVLQRKLNSLNKPVTSKTRLKIDRCNEKSSCRLIFINGFLYRSTSKSIQKTGSKKVDNRKKSLPVTSRKKTVIIKKLSGKQMKTVRVRGVTFQMATDGHSLQRIDTVGDHQTGECTSDVKVIRVDIGGVTYIQTKPGTLVRMATIRSRAIASRVVNKSISTITNKLRKKVNKQYCMYYNRFGKCKRDKKCPYLHDPDKIAVCTRFLRGTCKVMDCLFSHKVSQEKMPVCSYFLKGRCDKDDCPYLHVKVNKNAVICLAFINGYCPKGKECKKLHSRICSEFNRTGVCSKGKKCQLVHKKKRHTCKEISSARNVSSSSPVKELSCKQSLPAFISLADYNSPQTTTNKPKSDTTPTDDAPLLIRPRL